MAYYAIRGEHGMRGTSLKLVWSFYGRDLVKADVVITKVLFSDKMFSEAILKCKLKTIHLAIQISKILIFHSGIPIQKSSFIDTNCDWYHTISVKSWKKPVRDYLNWLSFRSVFSSSFLKQNLKHLAVLHRVRFENSKVKKNVWFEKEFLKLV